MLRLFFCHYLIERMNRHLPICLLILLAPSMVSATTLSCAELVDGLEGRVLDTTIDYEAIVTDVIKTHPRLCPAVTTIPVAKATFLDWATSNPNEGNTSASDCVMKAFSQNYSVCHSYSKD